MQKTNPHPDVKQYRVSVGHATVTVQGNSRQEAVQHARRQLCLELPRMWDLIESMDESRFEVAQLG